MCSISYFLIFVSSNHCLQYRLNLYIRKQSKLMQWNSCTLISLVGGFQHRSPIGWYRNNRNRTICCRGWTTGCPGTWSRRHTTPTWSGPAISTWSSSRYSTSSSGPDVSYRETREGWPLLTVETDDVIETQRVQMKGWKRGNFPLLPTGIAERFSQTISNLGHAALLRRCVLPL